MSRLCRNNMTDNPREYSEEHIILASIIEKFKLTPNQQRVISSVHNSLVGHFGLERTSKRLKEIDETWEFQRQHVRHFIDSCPCSQKMPILKISIHAHHFTASTYTPVECLSIDFVDPFLEEGYTSVIECMFPRWVELYHMISTTAFSAAECWLKHFGRFGAPHQ